jgi:phage terminase large subunit-like protein
MARGVTDAYDTIQVKHASGGVSILHFMSYEQGRSKFQGDTVDFIWFDEEPDEEVYAEGLTRTVATGGMVFITFTPLLGRSKVVKRFTDEKSPDRAFVQMTMDDAEHLTPEMKRVALAGYLTHQREARSRGVPMLGSGAVFQASEEMIKEPRIENIPEEWVKLWGIDFGIGHPFGAVLILWDKDADCIHVHHAIRMQGEGATYTPLQHAVPMKVVGAGVPVAWPQDGTAREKSGITIKQLYKNQGLLMLDEHATWPDGGVGTEAGILEMDERMTTGRLKVAAHLSDWFEEYRMYHRKDGLIVKIDDDLMSATRVAIMAKRFAKHVQLGSQAPSRRKQSVADGLDFDPF